MEFLSYLISGISLGSIYAIIALGYTMVYGIAKMLNFAHGDIIMIGGYVSFCSMYYLNLPPIVATLLAVIACTVLGIVIERLAYAPLRSAPSLAVLITAIGVSYFLQNSALLIWKAAAKTYPPVVAGAVQLFNGQLTISYISLLTIAACIVIMLALTILPEALREFADYRMLVYAIVLILVMLATHNPTLQSFFARLKPGKKEEKEAA